MTARPRDVATIPASVRVDEAARKHGLNSLQIDGLVAHRYGKPWRSRATEAELLDAGSSAVP
jgi:hypothetical protein